MAIFLPVRFLYHTLPFLFITSSLEISCIIEHLNILQMENVNIRKSKKKRLKLKFVKKIRDIICNIIVILIFIINFIIFLLLLVYIFFELEVFISCTLLLLKR